MCAKLVGAGRTARADERMALMGTTDPHVLAPVLTAWLLEGVDAADYAPAALVDRAERRMEALIAALPRTAREALLVRHDLLNPDVAISVASDLTRSRFARCSSIVRHSSHRWTRDGVECWCGGYVPAAAQVRL